MRTEVHTQRGETRAAAERRRNSLLALGSLVFHACLLLLIPGLVTPAPQHPAIMLELTAPEPVAPAEQVRPPVLSEPRVVNGNAKKATAPVRDRVVRQDTPLHKSRPAMPAAGRPREKVKPAARSPLADPKSKAAPGGKGPRAGDQAGSAPPRPSDSTDVTQPAPVTTTHSNTQQVDKPQSNKPAVGSSPTGKAKPQPSGQGTPGSARNGTQDGSGSSAGSGKGDKPAPNKGAPESGPAVKAQPNEGGQGGRSARPDRDGGSGPSTAPNSGPPVAPALPPGPKEADRRLLDAYGDKCRKKIRQLVRMPEIAKEKGHRGKVSFEFTVSRRGRLLGISITGGSGFPELDQECKEATRTAANSFGAFPADTPVSQWSFPMTLTFPPY